MKYRLPNHTPVFSLVLVICASGVPIANLAAGQEPKKEYARDFIQSFKRVQPDPKNLALSGLDADKFVKYEPEGWRMTLPAGYPRARPDVGVVTRFPVRGDFEITLDYEVLQESAPEDTDTSGARFGLTFTLNTPAINMATFTRRTAAPGIDYIAWRSVSMEPDGPTEAAAKTFKTMAKSGRLRLVRSDSTIFFYVAEPAEAEFKLLEKTTIRREDLRNVRIFGTTGDKNDSLDVRISNLRIRADAFPLSAKPPPFQPPPGSPPQLAERVEYLFHEGIAKQPMLRFTGGDAEALASIQPKGLFFNVPAGRKIPGDVGVESRLRLRGDFEVTLEYDLLAVPNPGPEFGAGASLQIVLDTPDDLKVRIGRTRKAVGARFGGNVITRGPDGKLVYKGLPAPAADDKESRGLLRIVRIGRMLSCQVAEGGGGYRVIATKEIELADVIAVQALCTTGWQPLALEVRIPRLEMRAHEMPNKAATVPDKTAKLPDKIAEFDAAPAERIEFQFRDGFAKNPMLRLVGADAASMAVVQPQGVRFNIPAGRENPGDVGIESRLPLRGDFEITLDYELVTLPNPPPPLGVGAVLQIVLDTPDGRKARMDRLYRPADSVFGANAIINGEFRGLVVEPADAKQTQGRLRMVRTGKMLSYQVQEGGPEFHETASFEIGVGDVSAVQALGATGWQPVAVAVRFPRLELRSSQTGGATEFERAADLPIAPPSSSGGGVTLVIVIGICVVISLAMIAGVAGFMWKWGGRLFATKSPAVAPAKKNAVMFACSDCGKKRKGKPELAGKKVKCPQCGKSVLVKARAEEDEA